MPELVGGSADLAPSTNTLIEGADSIAHHAFSGRNFHFGIREHAMGAIMNGIDAHGGLRIFGGDVPAVLRLHAARRSASRRCRSSPAIYVWTHDSIGLGEDGPTHQPIEHYAALRAIPNLRFVRPGDPVETVEAWRLAIDAPGRPDGARADAPEARR